MPDPDETNDDLNEGQISVDDLRALRKAAKERDDLAARMAQQERELAFAKAKLDLDDPKIKYFVKAYDGELTPEAIRTQAEADGFLEARRQATQQDVATQHRIANASAGSGETPNPRVE